MYRILFKDSDSASTKKIASALTKSGFEVMTVSSESEGLKMVNEISLDAVVIEESSQLDGSKLCQQIRLFDLPLILIGDKPEEEAYTPDMKIPSDWNYYMVSPINYEELAARIKVLLWRYGKAGKPGIRQSVGAKRLANSDSVILTQQTS